MWSIVFMAKASLQLSALIHDTVDLELVLFPRFSTRVSGMYIHVLSTAKELLLTPSMWNTVDLEVLISEKKIIHAHQIFNPTKLNFEIYTQVLVTVLGTSYLL